MEPQDERTIALQAHRQPVNAQDTMAEAGRKVLLNDFIQMLDHEEGSRSGEDIEHVHDMRVATRRMRSALATFAPYFKGKVARNFRARLKKVADALGAVRDLDVLIADLERYAAASAVSLDGALSLLNAARTTARHELHEALDKRDYNRFIVAFGEFLTTNGAKARPVDSDMLAPTRVRYILPALLYEHLGVVRAYDSVIETGDAETLHDLRIEFKRLRYLTHFFAPVLGSSAEDYIKDIKALQDHLGRMQDIQVASERLEELLPQLDADGAAALTGYIDSIRAEHDDLHSRFPVLWKKFNAPATQRKLANALVSL